MKKNKKEKKAVLFANQIAVVATPHQQQTPEEIFLKNRFWEQAL